MESGEDKATETNDGEVVSKELEELASPDVTDSEQELLDGGKQSNAPGGTGEGTGDSDSGVVSFPAKMKARRGALRKDMNFIDAIAFVVGGMIGSGIFITPATILQETGSFGVSMLCWLVGMVISILGALCYIELGLLIPKTGGEYMYILNAYTFRNRNKWVESFGSLLAFLFTWTTVFVIRPTSSAIVILTCVRYLTRPFYIGCEIPVSVLKTLALFIISKTTQPLCDQCAQYIHSTTKHCWLDTSQCIEDPGSLHQTLCTVYVSGTGQNSVPLSY